MKTRGRNKLTSRGSVVGVLCVLALSQICGCGWYLKPGRGKGPIMGGPVAESTGWGDGSGGYGAGEELGGTGGQPGAWAPGEGVESERTRLSGTPVAMLETVYFDYDKSNLRPDQLVTLERNLAYLKQHPGAKIRLEGHCDERGTAEYNLALGDRRAESVRGWLTNQKISGGDLESISKGELEPSVLGHDEGAWSKNRRVEFLILE